MSVLTDASHTWVDVSSPEDSPTWAAPPAPDASMFEILISLSAPQKRDEQLLSTPGKLPAPPGAAKFHTHVLFLC